MPAVPAALLLALVATPPVAAPRPAAPARPPLPRGAPVTPPASSPKVANIAPRLAAKIRRANDDSALHRFIARGLSPDVVSAHGGRVSAELGPLLSGAATGAALERLAPLAIKIDSPAPLRASLDHSRVAIGADRADFGDGFERRHRGAGVIVAAYDSGLDLLHPDFRAADGTSRVLALWDQSRAGIPPDGFEDGDECGEAEIQRGACEAVDRSGHGTLVLSIAAGAAPVFRGVAPEARLLVARDDEFDDFLAALSWFQRTAAAKKQPMVINLSLGGQTGAHDGTSLEAQAIDAITSPLVAAAGNDGARPVHASVDLTAGAPRSVGVRFPPGSSHPTALIDVWAAPDAELSVRVVVLEDGVPVVSSSTITCDSPGRTELLDRGARRYGAIDLDASCNDAFNNKRQFAIALDLESPALLSAVILEGRGHADLWVDGPASAEELPAFSDALERGLTGQVLGDAERSLSDPATARSAIAVSSFVSRTRVSDATGRVIDLGGRVGEASPFNSRGPTLSPERTGKKPEVSAPGQFVIGARSRESAQGALSVSDLYRAAAGTSMAAPHVAGAIALLLEVRPDATKDEIKAWLVESAADAGLEPPRLDAESALRLASGEHRCSCQAGHGRTGGSFAARVVQLAFLFAALWSTTRRSDRRGRLRGGSVRDTPGPCTPSIATRPDGGKAGEPR